MIENAQIPDQIYKNVLSLLASKQDASLIVTDSMNYCIDLGLLEQGKNSMYEAAANLKAGCTEDAKASIKREQEAIRIAENRMDRRVMDAGMTFTFGLEDVISALKTKQISENEGKS